ncbi:MAG: hypothetical protein ACOCYT_04750 [Chloroflexota bacterium]
MDAVEQLRQATLDFCAYVQTLPGEALQDKAWGPKEVLAHLVFWQRNYVNQVEAIIDGKQADLPSGTFDAINAAAVRASREHAFDTLIDQFKAVNARLCTLAINYDPDAIILKPKVDSVLRQSLHWFIKSEASHVRDHHASLQRQMQRNPQAEADALRAALDIFTAWVHTLTPAEQSHPDVLETLAQISVWHEYYTRQIEMILTGGAVRTVQGRRDEYAAIARQLADALDSAALLERLKRSQTILCASVKKLDPQDVVIEVYSGTSAQHVTLDSAAQHIAAHVRGVRTRLSRTLTEETGS